MHVDSPSRAPSRPIAGHRARALRPFGGWIALLALGLGIGAFVVPEAIEGYSEKAGDRAIQAEIPFGERDSVVSCGKRGVGISACISSEAVLRPKAQALWGERTPDQRRACLKVTGRFEPVGVLYSCLFEAGAPPPP